MGTIVLQRTVPVAVALVVYRDRALVLRRQPGDRSYPLTWCLPGGRLDPGETPEAAAIRETLEESGLRVRLERPLGRAFIHRPGDRMGLEIHQFLASTQSSSIVLSEEHVDSRWLDRDQAGRAETILEGGLAGDVTRGVLKAFSDYGLSDDLLHERTFRQPPSR